MTKKQWDEALMPDVVSCRDRLSEDYEESFDEKPEEGLIAVWWISRVPCDEVRYWFVGSKRGNLIRALTILVQLEIADLHNPHVTDNAGGMIVYEDGEWSDWYHPHTCEDTDEYLERNRYRVNKRLGIKGVA